LFRREGNSKLEGHKAVSTKSDMDAKIGKSVISRSKMNERQIEKHPISYKQEKEWPGGDGARRCWPREWTGANHRHSYIKILYYY